MRKLGGWVLLVAALAGGLVLADEGRVRIRLRGGEQVEGELLGFGERTFRVQVGDRVEEIPESQVLRIEFPQPAPQPAPSPSLADSAQGPGYMPVHRAPVDVAAHATPGRIELRWAPSIENEFVIVRHQVWRQLQRRDGSWGHFMLAADQGDWSDENSWVDAEVSSPTPRRYKVVSIARIDRENPVVARNDLRLDDLARERESEVITVTPNPGLTFEPLQILSQAEGGGAFLRVTAYDATQGAWVQASRVVRVGEEIPSRLGPTGVVLEEASESEVGGVARIRVRWPDGQASIYSQGGPLGPDPGGLLRRVEPPAQPARERIERALRERERRLSVNFSRPTPWRDVAEFVRTVTNLDVVLDSAVDPDETTLVLVLNSARQAEVLRLMFELSGLKATPYCETLYVHPPGEAPSWSPPAAALASELGRRLQEQVVSLDLVELPLLEAVDVFRQLGGLNLAISPRARERIEQEDPQVNVRAKGIQLDHALTLVVRSHPALVWTVRLGAVLIHDEGEEWGVAELRGVSEGSGAPRLRSRREALATLHALNDRIARHATVELLVQRGTVRSALGDARGALDDFRQALADEANHEDALLGLARCQQRAGWKKEALETLERLRGIVPHDPRVHVALGNVLLDLGRVGESKAALNRAHELAPDDPEVSLALGTLAARGGNLPQALHHFSAALERGEDEGAVLYARAEALAVAGQGERALQDLNRVIELDPSAADPLHARGMVRLTLGDARGALADFQSALTIDPELAQAYFSRGLVRRGMGDGEEALGDFRRATELDPNEVDHWLMLAEAAESIEESLAALERARALDPLGLDTMLVGGHLALRAGDLEQARRLAEQAVGTRPGDVEAWLLNARVHRQQGQLQEAHASCSRALRLAPERADVYLLRGGINKQLARIEEATADLRRALELGDLPAATRAKVEDMLAELDRMRR